jgi:hypothetical protein
MPSGVYLRMSPEELFWTKVDKTGECWLWTAGQCKGYGQFAVKRKGIRAHIYSYTLVNGPVPEGYVIRHICDTPLCVRPDHLLAGTQKENVQDAVTKGRHCHGETHGNAIINEDTARRIKALLNQKEKMTHIAKELGVGYYIVTDIKYGKAWSHV